MGGQCHTTLGNACYPKRAEAPDVRIVCLHFLMQLVPGFIPACAGATLRNSTSVPVSRVHPCVRRGDSASLLFEAMHLSHLLLPPLPTKRRSMSHSQEYASL
jgi:hypothetical protein